MRTTIYLNETSAIAAETGTLTLDLAESSRPQSLGEITIHLGGRPAVVAATADKFIEQLMVVRAAAIRRALREFYYEPGKLVPVKFGFEGPEVHDGFSDGRTWNGYDVIYITTALRNRWIMDASTSGNADLARELNEMPLTIGGFVDLTGWTTRILTADELEAAGRDPGLRDDDAPAGAGHAVEADRG